MTGTVAGMLAAASSSDVGVVGLALSGVLVAIAVGISLSQRLGLEGSILWACLRALVQLLLVGSALGLVIDDGRPLAWSWLWVVAMIAFAAYTTSRRAREVPGVLILSMSAYAAAATVSLGVLFGFRIFEMSGRTVVPLAGMVVGNSLSATVLVGRRIVAEFTDKRDEIEARLALGQTSVVASRPYARQAIRTALIPQIETTKATGIVFLPGAMVGLLLAGVSPMAAVKVQAAVMYLVLGSVATTTSLIALGLRRRLFTADERLVRLTAPHDG